MIYLLLIQTVLASGIKCRFTPVGKEDTGHCNIEQIEICTDGKKQWETGLRKTTAAYCPKIINVQPYNPKEWK